MFKLEIAIPVYKRPDKLKILLNSIYQSGFSDRLIISVYDDSDFGFNDNYQVVSSFNEKININYEKNNINLGIDKNISKCFERCSGKYILVVGEDDVFFEDGISKIIGILDAEAPKFLFLNYTYFNGIKDIAWNASLNKNYDTSLFLYSYIDKLGFIGSFIIESSFFNMQLYFDKNTYFNHVGCLLVGLDKLNTVITTGGPVIRNRVGTLDAFSWRYEALNVLSGFDKVLSLVEGEKLVNIDIPSLRTRVSKHFNPYTFKRLVRLKAENVLSNKEIFRLYRNSNFRLGNLIVILIPTYICQLVYFWYVKRMWS